MTENCDEKRKSEKNRRKKSISSDFEIVSGFEYQDDVRALFIEYAITLGVDLGFQNFPGELESLDSVYGPPKGRLFIARVDSRSVGCIALKPILDSSCEMKRLYVEPFFRKEGIGEALVDRLISEAEKEGYSSMYLDTFQSFTPAINLYEKKGFEVTEPYYNNPYEGIVYLCLDLQKQSPGRSMNGKKIV